MIRRPRWPVWPALLLILLTCLPVRAGTSPQGSDLPLTFWSLPYALAAPYPAPNYQEFVYHLAADAGPLQFHTGAHLLEANDLFDIAVTDGAGAPVGHGILTNTTDLTFNLPAAGQYTAVVRPTYAYDSEVPIYPLSAGAVNLQQIQGPVLPFIRMPNYPDYTGLYQPIDLRVAVEPPSRPISRIMLNDTVIWQPAPGDDATQHTIHLDPAVLTSGIYRLQVEAAANGSPDLTRAQRTFLVDSTNLYTDLPPGHWARQAVTVMSDLGILNGVGGGLFAPDSPVTRKEFAKMVALTFGLPLHPGAPSPFADAPGDWSQPYIDALYAAGLAQGEVVDGQRYFRPDRHISRAEAVTMIGRGLAVDQTDLTGYPTLFPDWNEVPAWALPSVAVLFGQRWIAGFPDGLFHPGAELSRAQAAKVLAPRAGLPPGDADGGGPRMPGASSGWMQPDAGPAHTGYNPGLTVGTAAALLWHSPISPVSQATLGFGLLFVSGKRSQVYGLLPTTGAILWQTTVFDAHGRPSTPVYDPDQNLVYVTGDGDGQPAHVTALNAANGRKVWESATPGQSATRNHSPAVAGGMVYVTAEGSAATVYAYEAATGRLIWRRDVPGGGTPAVADGRLFLSYADGQVFAFAAPDGTPLWERRTGASGGGKYTPIVSHGLVYVVTADGTLLALEPATGHEAWRSSDARSVAVDDHYVWVSRRSGGEKRLDPQTGAEVGPDTQLSCHPGAVGQSHAFGACTSLYDFDNATLTYTVLPTSLSPARGLLAADGARLYYAYLEPQPGEKRLAALQAP